MKTETKTKLKVYGIITFIVIIGFALATCKNDPEPTPHTHVWGEWVVTTAATETAEGEETRTCTLDSSHKEKRPVAKLTLISITVTAPPTKTDYSIDDTLDITGIEVTATYSDSTTGTVSITAENISGFDSSTAGSKILTVSYDGKTAAFTVTVTVPSIIEMVSIPSGTFTMGSPSTESGRWNDEGPQHQVTLSAFSMGKYEVTQAQYQAVMGSNPSYFTIAVSGESGTPGKLPVERVSWYDALVFCNKLSVAEGLTPAYSISGSTDPAAWGTVPTDSDATWNAVTIVSGSTGYRLPTEAQWEYACRAGTTTAYHTGETISDNTGWYDSNSGSRTHQAGLKAANDWGLYDMHGNVWEWCWDWYGTYASEAQTNPTGASSGSDRVERGGSWSGLARIARSAYRNYDNPSDRFSHIGFRLVRP